MKYIKLFESYEQEEEESSIEEIRDDIIEHLNDMTNRHDLLNFREYIFRTIKRQDNIKDLNDKKVILDLINNILDISIMSNIYFWMIDNTEEIEDI